MNDPKIKQLVDYFWPDGDRLHTPQVYAVVDGARDDQIQPTVRHSKLEYLCLYSGDLSPRLEAAAPHLVHLSPTAPLTLELLGRHWADSWGIFVVVDPERSIQQLRHHFRKFLLVQDEDGKRLAFRFYDPRVMRVYLPTCTQAELAFVFGDIDRVVMPNQEADTLLEFSTSLSGLKSKTVSLAQPSESQRDLNVVIKSDVIQDAVSTRSPRAVTD